LAQTTAAARRFREVCEDSRHGEGALRPDVALEHRKANAVVSLRDEFTPL
jgi:hypothetical protein